MLSKTDNMIVEKKIKSLSANIAGQLGIPEVDIHTWMGVLFPVLQNFYSTHGNRQIALVISRIYFSNEESEVFNAITLWEFMSRGIECFQIDMKLRIKLTDLDNSEIVTVCDYCYQNKVPVLHIFGEDCHLYNTEGRSVAFYNFVHPEIETRMRTGINARSFRDYKIVIEEQGTKQLISKIDEIWYDRKKRILISDRKTEKILQVFLAKWLDDNIHDARVISEVGKISGVDRTDIELTSTRTGDNVIIEVKWMGKNASGTLFDIERLEEGIRQVYTYLEREPSALEGCVVCYDGRQIKTEFSYDEPKSKLEYRIVWLESRSGSQIGAEG